MDSEGLEEIYGSHFTPALSKGTSLVIERGEGPYLITTSGEKYLDLVQGIAVNALGHCHPALVEAACGQIRKLTHGAFNVVSYPSALRLAAELRKWTPGALDMFFFSNTGAEAVEGCLKVARYTSGKSIIIAFRGGFHGRTMGATSVTSSNVNYRKHYAPFLPQVHFVPYPYCYRCPFGQREERCRLECIEYVKDDFHYVIPTEDVSAVLFEPVMGEGGYVVPPVKYVKALRELCDAHGMALIFDEVQTGVGRTGRFFASEHFGVAPDIMAIGKAIGGGFALGIVASTKERMERWETGSHGTTFGGHPVACAAALAQLAILTEKGFLEGVERKGERFREGLRSLKARFGEIGDVRGLGLMNAVEVVGEDGRPDPEKTAFLRSYLHERKVLVLACGTFKNVIRFVPPLNIEESLLDGVLTLLEEGLKKGRA
jgi:4-aminobutyrate aminotransferase